MTHFDAWKMTWGLDPVGFAAYADYLLEHEDKVKQLQAIEVHCSTINWIKAMREGADCWRRRATVAKAVLDWIAKYQKKVNDEERLWTPPRIVLLPDWWLNTSQKYKVVQFALWHKETLGLYLADTAIKIGEREQQIHHPPVNVFPIRKLSDKEYLRRRLIDLADRIGNSLAKEKATE